MPKHQARIYELLDDLKHKKSELDNKKRSVQSMFGPFYQLKFKIPLGIIHNDKFIVICEDLNVTTMSMIITSLPTITDGVMHPKFAIYYNNLMTLVHNSYKKMLSKIKDGAQPTIVFDYIKDIHVIRLFAMYNALRVYENTFNLPTHLKELLYEPR